MAKHIKAIKCPHCGSIGKTEIKADHFICSSCNTEYFLDNDDININHNINYNSPQFNPVGGKKIGLIIGCLVGAFFVFALAFPLLFSSKKSYNRSENVRPEFNWYSETTQAYANKNKQLIAVVFGARRYSGNDNENGTGEYITFYDLLSHKELKTQKTGTFNIANNNDFKLKKLSNGDLYAIANKTTIYKIDKENYLAIDVTQSLFKNHTVLASGIANAEFAYDSIGEAFNLMNNEGINLFYYPLIDKIFTKDEISIVQRTFEKKEVNEKLKTQFSFSLLSDDYPEEKIQLLKYTMKDNEGGPDYYVHLSWKNYKNKKILNYVLWDVIRSYTDLTPGRVYFNPKILFSDKDYVLIATRKTPAEKSPTNIQCIDAQNGKLIFNYTFPTNHYLDNGIRYKEGFVVNANNLLMAIGMDGKLIKEFETR
ncbi:hypothetical protein [Pedobacter sp. Leaf250]|uniref:hypothetical protein n=1 Tax=Pedobacter sp. Leaf250 TaxID=2876559 RepID=UPI001E37AC8B|nr:hypothetical protein [Pedobacter sp. Leaf250]